MSKYKNAPLVEAILEIKWGKIERDGKELRFQLPQEEQSLIPGKFQIFAEQQEFSFFEIIENQPPIPHIVRYRYRKKAEGYPLYQLGDGIFTVNQADIGEFSYDWEPFKENIDQGIKLLEQSYPSPIKELPLIDIQLKYRDAIIAEDGESIFDFITNKMDIGNISLPKKLHESKYVDTTLPRGTTSLQVACNNPEGQITCQVNQGIHDNNKAFIVDFIVTSKSNIFAEISFDSLTTWCEDAHDMHRLIFNALYNEGTLEGFK